MKIMTDVAYAFQQVNIRKKVKLECTVTSLVPV